MDAAYWPIYNVFIKAMFTMALKATKTFRDKAGGARIRCIQLLLRSSYVISILSGYYIISFIYQVLEYSLSIIWCILSEMSGKKPYRTRL
jgi:hypothetical protein